MESPKKTTRSPFFSSAAAVPAAKMSAVMAASPSRRENAVGIGISLVIRVGESAALEHSTQAEPLPVPLPRTFSVNTCPWGPQHRRMNRRERRKRRRKTKKKQRREGQRFLSSLLPLFPSVPSFFCSNAFLFETP